MKSFTVKTKGFDNLKKIIDEKKRCHDPIIEFLEELEEFENNHKKQLTDEVYHGE
jgi:hypothetical protein